MLQCFFNRKLRVFKIHRFRKEIKCAPVHGGSDVTHISINRNNNGLNQWAKFFKFNKQRHTVYSRYIYIA